MRPAHLRVAVASLGIWACASAPVASSQHPTSSAAAYLAARAQWVRDAKLPGRLTHLFADSARKDLEAHLHRLLGHTSFDGRALRISFEYLPGFDSGGEMLDGLIATASDTTVLVTHRELVVDWLRDRGYSNGDPFVDLANEDALTWVFWNNAHVYPYVDLKKSAALPDDVVFAQLVSHSQDLPSIVPDQLLVGLQRGDGVVLVMLPLVGIAPPEQCANELPKTHKNQYGHFDSEARAFAQCYQRVFASTVEYPRIVAQVHQLAAFIAAKLR
jgi:hypothetical protein